MTRDWMVLRCHPANTLRLADELVKAAMAAWVPKQVAEVRGRHARASRRVVRPLLPSFVFVPKQQAGEVYRRQKAALQGQIRFRPFRVNGKDVTVSDAQLSPLRMIELQLRDPKARKAGVTTMPFKVGETVRILEGPFSDRIGVVEGWDGVYCQVAFKLSTAKYHVPPFLIERFKA